MKTFFSILTLLFLASPAFAQNTDAQSYDGLMKRSRKARTTAIVMVSTGPVLAAGGIGALIYGLVQNEGDTYFPTDINGNSIRHDTRKYTTEIVVGAAATLVGLGVALSSIAFSKNANNLKREAKRVTLKPSTDRINIPGFQNNMAGNRTRQFKFSLVIPLCK